MNKPKTPSPYVPVRVSRLHYEVVDKIAREKRIPRQTIIDDALGLGLRMKRLLPKEEK